MRSWIKLTENLMEYGSDEDSDDINYVRRQQLLPAYKEFFDALDSRSKWTTQWESRDATLIHYYAFDLFPQRGYAGSKILAYVTSGKSGKAVVMISYRPEYDKRDDCRISTERKTFTSETIGGAMAYIEELERRAYTKFPEVEDQLRKRKFWTYQDYEKNLVYYTVDLYPENWGADGSKLQVNFWRDEKGNRKATTYYVKNPYMDVQTKKNRPVKKVFDDRNIDQFFPYIEQMEELCRQYVQLRK